MTNILMKILAILLAASTLFLSTGCATILKGSHETVDITSDPSGARVQINGIDVGTTPVSAKVDGTENQLIQVRKEGFDSRSMLISSSVGAGWVIVDVICGVWPIVIDAITGDWKSLDRNDAHFVLDKK
jgi:hypothetical protein